MGSGRKRHWQHWGVAGPVILIVIGAVLLLERTGFVAPHALSRWWPLLLIFIGVWLLAGRYNR